MSRRKQKRKNMNQANNNMQGSTNNNTNNGNNNNNYNNNQKNWNNNKVNVYQANAEIDSVLNEIAHGLNDNKDSTTAYINSRINNIYTNESNVNNETNVGVDSVKENNNFNDNKGTDNNSNSNSNSNNNSDNNNSNNFKNNETNNDTDVNIVESNNTAKQSDESNGKNNTPTNDSNANGWNKEIKNNASTANTTDVDKRLEGDYNDTLLISEKDKKVFLPYSMNDIHQYLTTFSHKYSNPRDVIENEFVLPLNYFTNISFAARFREAFALYRDREGKSTLESFVFAFKTMKVGNLQPAVIAACRNEKVFKDYLIHLKNNDLDNFNYFKIEYQVTPSLK